MASVAAIYISFLKKSINFTKLKKKKRGNSNTWEDTRRAHTKEKWCEAAVTRQSSMEHREVSKQPC